jgi:LmbE family N-acetylglucosaminyl deacetylase
MSALLNARTRLSAVLSVCLLANFSMSSLAADPPSPSAAILQDLRSFRETASVLYVAAHPDDENTLLIAYLARGKNYRTAYLSVTRGDGGQNVLGPDFDEKLGVARTQELLSARRLDGGRQFFTRAIDFGFSKDYRETLNIWGKDNVLADVVRVIRTFRPDVVITRFSTVPGGTHGHHTASAVLALEAFKLAGDPKAYPDQLKTLAPWQPKRILMNGRGDSQLHMEVSGVDPVSGLSFSDLAGQSRSMHKTQGFDTFRGGGGGARTESFTLLAGEPATNDILDGVDTTWARFPGGAKVGELADGVITHFNETNPAASVPPLLKLHAQLAALKSTDPLVTEKREQLDRIIQHCLGLEVATSIPQPEIVPGETLHLYSTASVHADIPVRWAATRYPSIKTAVKKAVDLRPGQPATHDSEQTLPTDTPLTQPYWLREEGTPGLFHVGDASLIGRPENPPVFPIEQVFEVGGQTLVIADQPMVTTTDSSGKDIMRKLDVIPPVSVHFESPVALMAPRASHALEVTVSAARDNISGTLRLDLPPGWTAAPLQQKFQLAKAGDKTPLDVTITAPADSTIVKIGASAEVAGKTYRSDREVIYYPHIPMQLLQPAAKLKAVSLDMQVRSKNIGYIPGAGDDIPAALQEMGCTVVLLDENRLTPEKLKGLDAIVIGVRAFNVRPHLQEQMPALLDYVEKGGTVVAQYNRPDNKLTKIAPYELHLSGDRVTDETATMTFLAPDHPVLNTPNKITQADFAGWVQERGTYFPDKWDEHFTPIFACNDPGENPLKGSLLIAQYGKGYFAYTGIVFFRELPAGVPGAYRLFANLISLGK